MLLSCRKLERQRRYGIEVGIRRIDLSCSPNLRRLGIIGKPEATPHSLPSAKAGGHSIQDNCRCAAPANFSLELGEGVSLKTFRFSGLKSVSNNLAGRVKTAAD
jgi:hypothetical protein